MKKMTKQEMIKLLKENGILHDERCTHEDLEALIMDESLLKKVVHNSKIRCNKSRL